jgi:hypothetical protein
MVALFARQLLFSWRPSCSHNAAYAVTSTCVEFLWHWFRIHDVLFHFFLCSVIVGKLTAFKLCFVFSVLYLVADHRYLTRSWAKWKVNEVDDSEFDSREGQEIFLFLKTSRLALCSLGTGVVLSDVELSGVRLTDHLRIVCLRMSGIIFSSPCIVSWFAQGK